jgi:hypothetical protein
MIQDFNDFLDDFNSVDARDNVTAFFKDQKDYYMDNFNNPEEDNNWYDSYWDEDKGNWIGDDEDDFFDSIRGDLNIAFSILIDYPLIMSYATYIDENEDIEPIVFAVGSMHSNQLMEFMNDYNYNKHLYDYRKSE